jgi:NAD(P)-dependent dehydrogenase (short-subunit alcohol dehydrogenase family)
MQGKVAIVTGGARGIGLATARLLAARGARVVSADLAPPADEEGIEGRVADVTDAAQVRDLVAWTLERRGRLDVLVANAGRPYSSTSATSSEEEWSACLDLNLKAAWYCAREAREALQASGRGAIVTVASIQGRWGGRNTFPYSAAKGGLLALTRSLAMEYAPRVRVNAVVPAQIESVRTAPYFAQFGDAEEARRQAVAAYPLGRLGKPEDVARAIAFLASDDAEWITGVRLMVDGGWSASLPPSPELH